MSDKKTPLNRIPYESITQLDKWTLPQMGGKVVSAAAKNARPTAGNERIEDVTGPVESKPLTAEQLRQITEEAEQEGYKAGFEKGLAEGHQKGLQQGEQQGQQKAYQETRTVLDDEKARLQSICNALMKPLDEQDRAVENLVVDIAVGLAKHVLHKELTLNPAALYGVVHQAVQALPMGASNIRVFLHPEDLAKAEELFAGKGKSWQFFADENLGHGGCRVESTESVVDYSVERRLRDYLAAVAEKTEVEESQLNPVIDLRPQEAVLDENTRSSAEPSVTHLAHPAEDESDEDGYEPS